MINYGVKFSMDHIVNTIIDLIKVRNLKKKTIKLGQVALPTSCLCTRWFTHSNRKIHLKHPGILGKVINTSVLIDYHLSEGSKGYVFSFFICQNHLNNQSPFQPLYKI